MGDTAPTIRERVQAGAAWLDQHQPDWLDRIDLITLDVGDPECCVLGQLYGSYSTMTAPNGRALGFDSVWSATQPAPYNAAWWAGNNAEYAELTSAWQELIQHRITDRIQAPCCPCQARTCDPDCPCTTPGCAKTEEETVDD